MSEPLRWSSITTASPPVLLAAASTSPALAWVGRDGHLFWQPSPSSSPLPIENAETGRISDLALSPTGEYLAWLTKNRGGWTSAGGDETHTVPKASYGGLAFADGHLLFAPSRATGDLLLISTRLGETRTLPLVRHDLDGLATALRDHGLQSSTVAALWIAAIAKLPDAEEVALGRRFSRRQIVGARFLEASAGRATLLVYRRGGRLVRLRHESDAWHRTHIKTPRRERLASGIPACLHSTGQYVASLLENGDAAVFDADGEVVKTWRPRPPGQPMAFRADGGLVVASAEGGLDVWRVPGLDGDVSGSGSALACSGSHLASFALRCVHPVDRPITPSIRLLSRLWTVGLYPPLVWIHDLLALLDGGAVGLPPGADPERAPESYRQALQRLGESGGLRRLRGIHPGPPALETTVARLLRETRPDAGFRPPEGEQHLVREALLRSFGDGVDLDPETLLPPGTVEAWEKALTDLDLDELRTVDVLGDAALSLPGCLADGFSLDILPQTVRAILSAVLRILPREVETRRRREHAASLTGLGGYGELARKGNLDNLLPSEHAFPAPLLLGRLLQGEALYYGRESAPPSLHESTWLVIDGSAAMRGDPLLLARAIGVAAARLAGREVEFRFFDTELGPRQRIERPGDVWQLIHGPTRLPPAQGRSSVGVWQGLMRCLQRRSDADARVHVVVVSHEFLGAEETDAVVQGLDAVSEQADLRLVMIQFPEVRIFAEQAGFEPWMMRGPSLVPERPPWKVLKERGVPVALVPVTRLWEVDA